MQVPKPVHRRRVPKQSKRNEFSQKVRHQIYEREQGLCRECGGPGEQIHHVRFRSAGGRGVYTNGVLLCQHCHEKAHRHKIVANKWEYIFEQEYGPDYYKDEWDE